MILLHNFLKELKPKISQHIQSKIFKEVEAYKRVPRQELKESIDHLYDAYLKIIINGDTRELNNVLEYLVRLRVGQHIPVESITKAGMCFLSALRTTMQEEFRKLQGEGRLLFCKAMDKAESAFSACLGLFVQIYIAYATKQSDKKGPAKSRNASDIDQSQFIMLRG